MDNGNNVVITCFGMNEGGGRLKVKGPIKRREVKRAIRRWEMGKAAGTGGITVEMLKFGGEAIIAVCSIYGLGKHI